MKNNIKKLLFMLLCSFTGHTENIVKVDKRSKKVTLRCVYCPRERIINKAQLEKEKRRKRIY